MDSHERHELKQNDLAEFLTHFKQWWDKNGTSFLLIIIIVLAGFYAYRWYTTKDAKANEAAWTAVQMAGSPEQLQDAARQYMDMEGAWCRATLDAADALLTEATAGIDPAAAATDDPAGMTLTPEQQKEKFQAAADLYQRVIDRGEPLFTLSARYGLAAAYESLGDFDKAAAQYAEVRTAAASQWPTVARQAERQAADIARLKQPVEFAPNPPAPEMLDGPATGFMPEGANSVLAPIDPMKTNVDETTPTPAPTDPPVSTP